MWLPPLPHAGGWSQAALRLTAPPGGPDAANAELKAVDGSTNPYIALSALLGIIMHGEWI